MANLPTVKNEINYTTVLAILGIIGVFWNASANYTKLSTEALQMKARQEENYKETAALRVFVESQSRQLDNLLYRMSVQEGATKDLTSSTSDLNKTISNATSDIRLIREMLTRMESERSPKVREKL